MGNSLICSILEAHLPHSLHRSATVNTPANRLHAHSLGRYQQAEKKKDRVRHRLADLKYTFALI